MFLLNVFGSTVFGLNTKIPTLRAEIVIVWQ